MIFKHTLYVSPVNSEETFISTSDVGRVYLTQGEDEIAMDLDELIYIVELAKRMEVERNA